MKRFIPFIAKDPVVSVVTLSGVIAASSRGGTLSDSALAPAIERAFAKGKPAAVALVLNSPGGSPAQSSLIAARIRRLADDKKIPVHAFVEDVAASGGYWLACAADDIWIDESSVVGSIGVISAGFGLHEAIARIGVERRVYTVGQDKSMLDPFRPERAEDVERLKGIQAQIHEAFIGHVKARRGARLVGDDLFTGEFWVRPAGCRSGAGRRHRAYQTQDEGALRRQGAVCASMGRSAACSSGSARSLIAELTGASSKIARPMARYGLT